MISCGGFFPARTIAPDGTTVDIVYRLYGASGGENTITTIINDWHNDRQVAFAYFDDLGRPMLSTEFYRGNERKLVEYRHKAGSHNIERVYDANRNFSIFEHDSLNRVTSVERFQHNRPDHALGSQTIVYDDFNRTVTASNAGHTNTRTYFDEVGRAFRTVTKIDGNRSAVTYSEFDHMSNVTRTRSPMGEWTNLYYDPVGRLVKVIDPMENRFEYTYDAMGNILTVTSNGQRIQTNQFDNLGRLLRRTDAMGMSEYFAYDVLGRLVASRDRKMQVSSFDYRPNTNLLRERKTWDSTLGDYLIFTYDHDDFGRVERAENNDGITYYSHTPNGLLESITTNGKTITYTHDANRNITSVLDHFGTLTEYRFDGLNRVRYVIRAGQEIARYGYHPFGLLRYKMHVDDDGNPHTMSIFYYDNAGRLVNQINGFTNNSAQIIDVINEYIFEHDRNGNIRVRCDNGERTEFKYDAAWRLTDILEPCGTLTAYTFDGQGNISTRTITRPETSNFEFEFTRNEREQTISGVSVHNFVFAYDANNRLRFESEFVGGMNGNAQEFLQIERFMDYDANGNLRSIKTTGQIDESVVEFGYNALNQLTSFVAADGRQTTYGYAPNGLRNRKTTQVEPGSLAVVTTNYYWDRGFIANETVNGVHSASNFIGVGGIFGRENFGPNGCNERFLMLKNWRGDVVSLIGNNDIRGIF